MRERGGGGGSGREREREGGGGSRGGGGSTEINATDNVHFSYTHWLIIQLKYQWLAVGCTVSSCLVQ